MTFGIGFAWHLATLVLYFATPLLAALVLYWLIRLAVRHGIQDAWRRRAKSAREDAGWDPASH